ncbi:MAG: thiamine pyrophosphate-dependent enzyme [Rhodospirillales bacterium]|nr:thiamine pyrophosphate-dependent enzyme [Rhodospirillales bacterium]
MARTLARGIAAACRARGVRRAFGVPGGASSLDVIDAFAAEGIDFVLTHGETPATLMAAVTAELGGAPGVVVTGVGPGAASAVNGAAYAALERAPVLLVTDALAEPAPGHHALHQRFDQRALFAPLVKAYARPEAGSGLGEIESLLDTAAAHPAGPVQLDLTTAAATAPAEPASGKREAAKKRTEEFDLVTLAEARGLLAASSRPLVLAGMEARGRAASAALRQLARTLGCPVMTTYKAKGAIADSDPLAVGSFTGAASDARCLERADLLIFFGLDPVELLPGPWRFEGPILALAAHGGYEDPALPAVKLTGALDRSAAALADGALPAGWPELEIAALRTRLRAGYAMVGAGGRTAEDVVTAVRREAPAGARLTVDSGAHMFSAMGLWQADEPDDVLKSNGLSTMGFALPAAIASALEAPARPVIAMTGDGGLHMCLAELATAARHRCRIAVVVFNDSRLALIDIKQQRQQRESRGVRFGAMDHAAVARGLGCRGWRVEAGEPLTPALAEAFAHAGPALIDVTVDADAYTSQYEALRG